MGRREGLAVHASRRAQTGSRPPPPGGRATPRRRRPRRRWRGAAGASRPLGADEVHVVDAPGVARGRAPSRPRAARLRLRTWGAGRRAVRRLGERARHPTSSVELPRSTTCRAAPRSVLGGLASELRRARLAPRGARVAEVHDDRDRASASAPRGRPDRLRRRAGADVAGSVGLVSVEEGDAAPRSAPAAGRRAARQRSRTVTSPSRTVKASSGPSRPAASKPTCASSALASSMLRERSQSRIERLRSGSRRFRRFGRDRIEADVHVRALQIGF